MKSLFDPRRAAAQTSRSTALRLLVVVQMLLALLTLSTAPTFAGEARPPIDAAEASETRATGAALSLASLRGQAARPLHFEPNRGQVEAPVKFLARGGAAALAFEPTGLRIALSTPAAGAARNTIQVRLEFLDARADAAISSTTLLPGLASYYLGNDPKRWLEGIPTYAGIVYSDLYDGIDLLYDGSSGHLKGTYVVAPQSDPEVIRWRYTGADSVTFDEASGELHISLAGGRAEIVEAAAVAWQDVGQVRSPVSLRYLLDETGIIRLAVGEYDRSLPLIIDPTLTYSTYHGEGDNDQGGAVAVDAAGSFCMSGAMAPSFANAFNEVGVLCYNASGVLLFSTFVGGDGYEGGADITIAANGNIYVTGLTSSTNFPTTDGSAHQGLADVFVLRLTGGLGGFASIVMGGAGDERGLRLAQDPASGDLWVSGGTNSAAFSGITPATAYQPAIAGGTDGFLVRLDAGLGLLYGTYIGGTDEDCHFEGCLVAIDAAGRVYFAGHTSSASFPLLNGLPGYQKNYQGGGTPGWAGDAFAARFTWTSGGLSADYSTYLGGSNFEEAYSLAVDNQGRAVLVGTTASRPGTGGFPITPFAVQGSFGGGPPPNDDRDGFVTRLDWNGATLSLGFSTYLGGSHSDDVTDVAIDATDNIYVIGSTYSTDLALHDPLAGGAAPLGDRDAFVASLSPNGALYRFNTYLGGANMDRGAGIAVNAACDVYVTGTTASPNFPLVNAWDSSYNGAWDAFVARLSDGCPIGVAPNVNDLILSQGQTFTETITVTVPAQPPCVVDIYFLADTTGSMGSIIGKIQMHATAMLSQIAAELPGCQVAFGVGNYKDFPNDPYAFQHQQSITTNTTAITNAINAWFATGGVDVPEGQLYALTKIGQNASGSVGWRPGTTSRIVLWFGDAPAHEPICQSIHNDPTLPYDIDLGTTITSLTGINVVAVDASNLNGSDWSSDYAGCAGNQTMTPAGQAQAIATATGGAYQAVGAMGSLVNTIVSLIGAVGNPAITNLCLTPTGGTAGSVTSISPACYGPLDPTVSHTLPFEVTFAGNTMCTPEEQVFTGTIDVVADGEIVGAKTVTIRVPQCPACDPVDIVLNTGTTMGTVDPPGTEDLDWSVAATSPPPAGQPPLSGSGWTVTPPTAWVADPRAKWIDPYNTGGLAGDPADSYTFTTRFNLNTALHTNFTLVFETAADNAVSFTLNGNPINGSGNFLALSGPFIVANQSLFLDGQNLLQARVRNDSGPVGFLFIGRVTADCINGCTRPPDSMVAWWPLDETIGSTARDIRGGHDGAHEHGPSPAGGIVQGALRFTAANQRVTVPHAAELNLPATTADAFTIDAWVQTSQTSGIGLLVAKASFVNTGWPYPSLWFRGYILELMSGIPRLVIGTGCSAANCSGIYASGTSVADGNPHHVTVTVDRADTSGSGGRWYIDGTEVVAARFNPNALAGSAANTSPIWLGGNFIGVLDEVELFERALADWEVARITAARAAGKCKPVLAVTGGEFHSAALAGDGTVLTWGWNMSLGLLGDGTNAGGIRAPARVVGPGGAGVLDNVVAISAAGVEGGWEHTLAVRNDRSVWSWGDNSTGQLGNNAVGGSSAAPIQVQRASGGPLTNVRTVAAGDIFSLALDANGRVWAWGDNLFGQLGQGTTGAPRPSALMVTDPSDGTGFLTNVIAIAAGPFYDLALKSDGTVRVWGQGPLGNNTAAVGVTSAPVQVSGPGGSGALLNITAIAAGGRHALARDALGRIWAWGANGQGQLGVNSTAAAAAPVQVTATLMGVVRAIGGGLDHSLAIDAAGHVWGWGDNGFSQVATAPQPALTPFRIVSATMGMVSSLAPRTVWQSLAVNTDGEVWGWGSNQFGELNGTLPPPISTATSMQVVP